MPEKGSSAAAYWVVEIAGSRFAVADESVHGDLEPVAVTPVPRAPRWVRGLAMLRGQPVPVIRTAAQLGLEGAGAAARLLCVEIDSEGALLEVDGPCERALAAGGFEPASEARPIAGYIEVGGDRVPIIDLARITKEEAP